MQKRLAALVCRKACETVAHKLELQNFFSHGARTKLKVSCSKRQCRISFLGAMYLDGGLSPCQKFILEWWQGFQDPPPSPPKDAKHLCKNGLNPLIKQIPFMNC